MTPDNQVLLDAIRELGARMGRMEGRLDGMDARFDQVDARFDQVDARFDQVEARVETIDARTSQLSSDFLDLRDRVVLLEERVDHGFRALRSDLKYAFADARRATTMGERHDKAIDELRGELAGLRERLAALESAQGGSQA